MQSCNLVSQLSEASGKEFMNGMLQKMTDSTLYSYLLICPIFSICYVDI